jgi:hypothetical protein
VGGAGDKNDRSKRGHFSFGGKVLTDKKSPPIFLRSMFIPTHYFLCFFLFFLSVPTGWVRKRCERKLGGQFGQFITKSPLQGMLIPSQITCCGGPVQLTMQQSTYCWREDEWRYGNGGQQWWRMMTGADNDNTCDWARDCNGEGRERAVRDGGDGKDGGVVMMAAAAEGGGGR